MFDRLTSITGASPVSAEESLMNIQYHGRRSEYQSMGRLKGITRFCWYGQVCKGFHIRHLGIPALDGLWEGLFGVLNDTPTV